MYYNIANKIIPPTMRRDFELVSAVAERTQKSLNEAAGSGIKALVPEINEDRIRGIVNRVSSEERFDDISWMLLEPIINFSQSIVNDFVKQNAEFWGESGHEAKIVRKMARGCCEWCAEIAGTYTYPDVPQDVYRRHERCRCTVEYDPGDGRRQNVHTKKWKLDEERDKMMLRDRKNFFDKDILIHKSVGAKSKNYNVLLPDNTYAHFTEGTSITKIQTIAGHGRNRKIDEIDILVYKYGGHPQLWQKKKGICYVDVNGESYKAEVHWYEEPTIGKVNFKLKSKKGEWFIDG